MASHASAHLSLGLRMVRWAPRVPHALLVEPLGRIIRHATRSIVAEKPSTVREGDVVKGRIGECLVEGGCDVKTAMWDQASR